MCDVDCTKDVVIVLLVWLILYLIYRDIKKSGVEPRRPRR